MAVVHFGKDRYEATAEELTGAELRRLFNVPSDDDLFRAKGNNKVDGPAIGETESVSLKNGDHFTSVPRNIQGGAR